MQKTKFLDFLYSSFRVINPIISDSWSRRSILLLSLLLGFYFTNSTLSYLLDKSFNTILITITIVLIIELLIRLSSISALLEKQQQQTAPPASGGPHGRSKRNGRDALAHENAGRP